MKCKKPINPRQGQYICRQHLRRLNEALRDISGNEPDIETRIQDESKRIADEINCPYMKSTTITLGNSSVDRPVGYHECQGTFEQEKGLLEEAYILLKDLCRYHSCFWEQ